MREEKYALIIFLLNIFCPLSIPGLDGLIYFIDHVSVKYIFYSLYSRSRWSNILH